MIIINLFNVGHYKPWEKNKCTKLQWNCNLIRSEEKNKVIETDLLQGWSLVIKACSLGPSKKDPTRAKPWCLSADLDELCDGIFLLIQEKKHETFSTQVTKKLLP